MSRNVPVSLVIVGGGPAGLAPLFAAGTEGKLDDLLAGGVVILEAGCRLGSGSLREYAIRSDSVAEAFLDIVRKTRDPRFQQLREHPAAYALADHVGHAVPLSLVADFLEAVASTLREIIVQSPGCAVLTSTSALWTKQVCRNFWQTCFRDGLTGCEHVVESCSVVLATGGYQPPEVLLEDETERFQGLSRFGSKLLQSGDVLVHGGVQQVKDRLCGVESPKVVVIGGSASAGAVTVTLLSNLSETLSRALSILVLHRNPIRLFCESVSAAALDGYTDFTPDDICSLTGRIHRFAGLRLDSRELFLSALNIGGRQAPRSLALRELQSDLPLKQKDTLDRADLNSADLIITALGYVPRLLPVFDSVGRPVALKNMFRERASAVDQRCRVLDHTGRGLDGLFAIGLAAGPPPLQNMGGEKGFRGQVNSLWLWQHPLGLRVAEGILGRRTLASGSTRSAGLSGVNTEPFRPLSRMPEGLHESA